MQRQGLRYLLLIGLIYLPEMLLPQDGNFHVQILKHNRLLNPAQIEEIRKDDRGFLWLMSPTAVQRFDGRDFKTFSFDDRCMSLEKDAAGRMWLLTRQHVYRFANDYEGFKELPQTASPQPAYRKLCAVQKNLYLLTVNGIKQWNEGKEIFEPSPIPPFTETGGFQFLKSSGPYLFYRHSGFVFRYQTGTKQLDSIKFFSANYVSILNADSLWAREDVGNSYLVSFKTKTAIPIHPTQFEKPFANTALFVLGGFRINADKHFVLLQQKGSFLYSASHKSFSPLRLFYEGRPLTVTPFINCLYQDEEGTAWFPYEDGLVHFTPAKPGLQLLRSHPSNSAVEWSNQVKSFSEDRQGNIWFSTTNGFCKLDVKTGSVKTWLPKQGAKDYLNYASVRSIGCDGDKVVIGQSEGGFWIFDTRTETFTRPSFAGNNEGLKKKFLADFNSNMIRLRNGNFLVLSRSLYLIKKGSLEVSETGAANIGSNRSAFEDAQGRIWLTGSGGVTVTDSTFRPLFVLKDSVLGRWANAAVQIDANKFWLAARGVSELSITGKGLTVKPIFSELKAEHISGFFKDSLNRIWMNNAQGMFRYVPTTNTLEKFDETDNAQNFYTSYSTSYRASNGTVYFGTLNGITQFKPETIPLQKELLKVQLTNVSVNGDDSTFQLRGALPSLAHFQNSLVFDFVAPYMANASRVLYRYRLDGSEGDWVNTGNNTSVRFSSLPPGRYTFRVAASLNGKDWQESPHPLSFSIAFPFWRQWWFTLLVLTTTVLLLSYFIKRHIRMIKEKEARKTELEKLKADNYQYQLEIAEVINYFAASINKYGRIDDMLWDVARNCISKLGFEDCVIYLMDEDRAVLQQKAAWGPKTRVENKIINPLEIPLGQGIVGCVALSGKAEKIDDTAKDSRYIIDDETRASELSVPIFDGENVIGVIDSEHPAKNFYTSRHLQILTTIASHCGARISTIKAEQTSAAARLDALLNKQKALEASLQSMRLQMNPHFLFNALNSIQQMILAGEETTATRFLSKFSKLLRTVLTNSSREEISLKKEIDLLQLYVELESLRFKESFNYSIDCDEDIDPLDVFVPALLLQPLVENAIWHGLMHKEGQRQLGIEFRSGAEGQLLCRIEDNGIGRQASPLNGDATKHTGKGVTVAVDRLRLLNEKNGTANSLHIVDMKDEAGKAIGTRIEIVLYN